MEEQKAGSYLCVCLVIFIAFAFACSMAICLTGCTYAVTMVHTEGVAEDVVDEEASNTPSLSVPMSLIPKPSIKG